MDILIAFLIGAIGGSVIVLFVTGASMVKKEQESYMEGYLAGKKEQKEKIYDFFRENNGN